MATRIGLLKLSKTELIKRCKKRKIKIPTNVNKSKLITLLLQHNKDNKSRTKSKAKLKLPKINIIPYTNANTKINLRNSTGENLRQTFDCL